jgi:hypothetical protein
MDTRISMCVGSFRKNRKLKIFIGGSMKLEITPVKVSMEKLEELIGAEQARKVAAAFAGSALYFPRSVLIEGKHRDIRREAGNGAGYRDLAEKYGYTERRIRQIVREPAHQEPAPAEAGGKFGGPGLFAKIRKLLGGF